MPADVRPRGLTKELAVRGFVFQRHDGHPSGGELDRKALISKRPPVDIREPLANAKRIGAVAIGCVADAEKVLGLRRTEWAEPCGLRLLLDRGNFRSGRLI